MSRKFKPKSGRPAASRKTPAARPSAPPPTATPSGPVRLEPGEPAPLFTVFSDVNPNFRFDTVAGRWSVLAFVGPFDAEPARAARAVIEQSVSLFDGDTAALFLVADTPRPKLRSAGGYRYFFDPEAAVATRYGVFDGKAYRPTAFLIDPSLRLVAIRPLEQIGQLTTLMQQLMAEEQSTAPVNAPVLLLPRIFEPELCQTLIAYHGRTGGQASGFMREVEGETVLMHDTTHKRRKDVLVEEEDLRIAIRRRIERRLLPMIERALGWKASRLERYLIARYADEDLGFFNAHRDNTTPGTAHRKFAVSINLNADYDGGELRFPEFGRALYKPTLGGACVFNCSLQHEAKPVTRGERFVFVPFLFDEEGERIRKANLGTIRLEGSAFAAQK